MKKFFKIFLIAFVSLLSILILTAGIAWWIIFTPERITPIVRKQADKYLNCQSEIGEVDLTLYSTWPNLGLRIKQLSLINPVPGATADTLVKVDEFTGILDARAWRQTGEWILVGLELHGGSIYVFSDSLGNTNYDIVSRDSLSSPDTATQTTLPVMDIRRVVLEDVNVHYEDQSSNIIAGVIGLDAAISGSVGQDAVSGRLELKKSRISLEYGGEKYLDGASVRLDIPVEVIPTRQYIDLDQASLSVNDLVLGLDGSLENDTLNKTVRTDINYKLRSWSVEDIQALIPASFHSYLEGIEGGGILTSEGKISGELNDSVMPWMDIHLVLEDGNLDYQEIPLPLHGIKADINLYTDLKDDILSYLQINSFQARTTGSTFSGNGRVTRLFSDPDIDLTSHNSLWLEEFVPLVPDSLLLDMKGRADAKIFSRFRLSQLKNMQLEKLKLSGSLGLTDFHAAYDSIELWTDRTRIDFSLPNRKASTENTRFATARISADNLRALKPDFYQASLSKASVRLETSDVRDTTRIPDIIFVFAMDTLHAEMDTLSLAVSEPQGEILLFPRYKRPDQPRMLVSYNSDEFHSNMGEHSARIENISLETDVQHDDTQEDFFLKWMINGFIDMNQGRISLADLPHPLEIPSVKMNVKPEAFNIEEAGIKYDNTDFNLSGSADNVLSYFRGDSILRGNFSFVSDMTDVGQLMALSSGLGSKDTLSGEEEINADSAYSGPYMVPEGIDLLLSTNIKRAVMGEDTARDIKGDVRIKDGVLVLDGLTLTTPAARMQVTSMYETPRKNHLYVGLDYHMLDVEISELLNMIPDIDTLMPMLRSFAGEAEFHIAVETYMDSLYNIKKSTLRGASSIRGSNLVLMDGETFSEMANKLKFNKKTENKVDSLSAEFTIFRNEIDIYPFLIVMDKYKAVVAGRHNFDMSFAYHVSLVESPVPIKLGVDLNGNLDDINVDLAKCRYAEFYRPASRGAVQSKQLELRQMIRDILTQKVKD